MTWVQEETLFFLLYWISPVFTCIAITIQMCEGLYLSLDSPNLIFYRDNKKRLALICMTPHPGFLWPQGVIMHSGTHLLTTPECSLCAKTPLSMEKAMDELVVAKIYMLFTVLSRVVELVIYVIIFMRQTEIESRASLYVIKDEEPVSYRR